MKRIINSVIYASFCIVALLFAQTAMAQKARTITGQVLDNTGQPMIGATVVVVGKTNVGTTTDTEGKYKIKASSEDNLSFSFLGYVEVTERVGNRTNINIVLNPENRYTFCNVGIAEIFLKMKTKHLPKTDGHIGIS